jgi:hypothetical protein
VLRGGAGWNREELANHGTDARTLQPQDRQVGEVRTRVRRVRLTRIACDRPGVSRCQARAVAVPQRRVSVTVAVSGWPQLAGSPKTKSEPGRHWRPLPVEVAGTGLALLGRDEPLNSVAHLARGGGGRVWRP